MLQPVQLQDVFAQYPREITELRRFLVQAGVPVQTERVASYMAGRLAQDRRFHRDLMSYLWVLLDEHPQQIGAAELLGMLAIAAAGIPNASQMEEDDAHDLLRFVMESRRALGSAERPHARQERPAPAPNSPVRPAAEPTRPQRLAEAPVVPMERAPQPLAERPAPRLAEAPPPRPAVRGSAERTALQREQPPSQPEAKPSEAAWLAPEEAGPEARERNRRRLVYAFSGACVVALLVGGYGLLHHSEPVASTIASAPVDESSTTTALPRTQASRTTRDATASFSPAAPDDSPGVTPQVRQRLGSAAQDLSRAASPGSQLVSPQGALLGATPATSSAAGAPVVRQPETARLEPSPAPLPSAAPIVRTGTTSSAIAAAGVTLRTTRPSSGVPQPVSASSLSRQLDSPRMPVYANDPDVTAAGKPYPRLRRRNTSGPLQENDPELEAEMHAPNLTGAAGGSRAATHAVLSGVVRGTCLGMMAGNLMYSPTPAYPQAAAAARVQGEVKIQATIDRDGSVSSARVVSGPPLLRDAALDAVQHWRYKPYTNGGKPSPTGTTAVVEFQMQ